MFTTVSNGDESWSTLTEFETVTVFAMVSSWDESLPTPTEFERVTKELTFCDCWIASENDFDTGEHCNQENFEYDLIYIFICI